MDRRSEERFFKALMIGAVIIVIGSFFAVVAVVVLKGAPALTLSMITQTPKGGYYLGKEGGILNAIGGSLYLAFGSVLLAMLISLPVSLGLQNDYIKRTRVAYFIRLSLDVLWGTPSIVYGAFGFTVMIYLGLKSSLLAGIMVLTILQIPIMIRSLDETVRLVPNEMKEASFALGATRFETTFKVVTRQVLPGIATSVLLAFGRGIGDAASILFTAGYTDNLPGSLLDPVASLPLAILFQLSTPYPEVQQRAYASALILMIIVLSVSIAARTLSRRLSVNIIK